MKKLLISALMVCFAIGAWAQSASSYNNPVLPGFHPDPSCVRVGDDYYTVNSSFQYFPGVPIYHSKDLVNWEQVGNVLDRKSQLPLKDATSWLGIYAPTIRYNNGTYYMITTNVGNGGNFMVTATNPKGPWSEPLWLEQQGIDPSLYFEGDICYMVSNPDGQITLCQIDPKTGKQLTPSKAIWGGAGGRYPEGPHIYKKDGWYYLLISEGGTELAHHLTIARSRNIYGPYEANPANPILTNCNHKGEGKQIQGCGHGDFVQDHQGNWWVIFLAYRNYGGSYHHLGRETYLAPVEWKEGEWPVVYGGEAIDTVMQAKTLPLSPMPKAKGHYDFTKDKLDAQWIHLGQPVEANYEYKSTGLRLHASTTTLDELDPNTFIGIRQTSPTMVAELSVNPNGLKTGSKVGLSVFQIFDGHYDFYVTPSSVGYQAQLRCKLKGIDYVVNKVGLPKGVQQLRITSDGLMYHFLCQTRRGTWTEVGALNTSLLSTEVAGGFTGVTLGIYCNGASSSYADVLSFDYTE